MPVAMFPPGFFCVGVIESGQCSINELDEAVKAVSAQMVRPQFRKATWGGGDRRGETFDTDPLTPTYSKNLVSRRNSVGCAVRRAGRMVSFLPVSQALRCRRATSARGCREVALAHR